MKPREASDLKQNSQGQLICEGGMGSQMDQQVPYPRECGITSREGGMARVDLARTWKKGVER